MCCEKCFKYIGEDKRFTAIRLMANIRGAVPLGRRGDAYYAMVSEKLMDELREAVDKNVVTDSVLANGFSFLARVTRYPPC